MSVMRDMPLSTAFAVVTVFCLALPFCVRSRPPLPPEPDVVIVLPMLDAGPDAKDASP